MVTLFGPTGRLGSEVVRLLRSRGALVRAVSRAETRLGPALALGAEGRVGDLCCPETLPPALEGTLVLVITANAVLVRAFIESSLLRALS
jgi:uncharacterized protein YbjT (DUF2867 family)